MNGQLVHDSACLIQTNHLNLDTLAAGFQDGTIHGVDAGQVPDVRRLTSMRTCFIGSLKSKAAMRSSAEAKRSYPSTR
jgi:hypothetical protein